MANIRNIKIKTKGMHCQSCEMLVKESIEELEGIKNANADHKSGIIEVDFDDSKVEESAIKAVISKEGYKPE